MTNELAEQLEAALVVLDRQIRSLRRLGCQDTAWILAVARLDLQTKIHGISTEELEAFCGALDCRGGGEDTAQVIDFASRARRKA